MKSWMIYKYKKSANKRRKKLVIKIFLTLCFIFSPNLNLHAQDDADLNKEAYFHRIYKEFNLEPTSEEDWMAVVKKTQGQSYTIQDEDTLWDISKTFFADPFFYPKIWSLNSESILNPHEINDGMVLKFNPGSLDEAPSMDVQESDEDEEVAAEPSSEEGGEKANEQVSGSPEEEEVSIPEPSVVSKARLQPPSSIPFWEFNRSNDKKYILDLDNKKVNNEVLSVDIALSYYLDENGVSSLGTVTEFDTGFDYAVNNQYIMVKIEEGVSEEETQEAVPKGHKFLIIKSLGFITDDFSDSFFGKKGEVIQIQGEIEIDQRVNKDKNIYRALVTQVWSPIESGASLVKGGPVLFNYNAGEEVAPPEDLKANIIGGQYGLRRRMFGNNQIVFLNQGQEAGLNIGQSLSIFKDQSIRNEKTKSYESLRTIGKLKIVRVTKEFSTAVILDATEDILVGDKIGRQ